MINDHNLCTLNKHNALCATYKPVLWLYNKGSTNTVESSLPKHKTSKAYCSKRSKQKPCKNICFWGCSNVGVSLFKYETKTSYHSQNMSGCLCMHISYFGWNTVRINGFTLPDMFFFFLQASALFIKNISAVFSFLSPYTLIPAKITVHLLYL